MDRSKNILKNTFKFMASFIIMTIIFLIIFSLSILFVPTGKFMVNYVPVSKVLDPETLDWKAIGDIGGKGMVINDEGKVEKFYVEEGKKTSYTKMELMNLFNIRGNDKTIFPYDTPDKNKLLIIYPDTVFTSTPNMDVDGVMGEKSSFFPVAFIIGLGVYLFLIYIIIKRLTKGLKKEFDLIRAEEDKKENMFFRGLAHDIKTPLSTMIAYSKALEDGVVEDEEVESYYKSIYNNGIILKERVDDMMELTTLGDEGIFSPEKHDILEAIRRFVGDNYPWFMEKDATVNIEFHDKESFIITYDNKLFKRLLENLLQNSVYHNEQGVNIFIRWNNKEKKLTISDDGIGIAEDIKENMWDPMVTGDESRTGEKLRGMGLANVKRIVELHGWKIEYDKGFKIWIR